MSEHAMRTVVVTQRFFDEDTVAYLNSHGCEVRLAEMPPGKADGELSEDTLVQMLADAEGWIVGHARVTRQLLGKLPRLRVIARRGVGYERVDTQAVADLGKVAAIAVGGNDACVADHALALMLAVSHRLRESQMQMNAGSWNILTGADLYRKTVGIVGLGRIGRGVVQRLKGFEARLLAVSASPDDEWSRVNGVAHVEIDELLTSSDVVSLHAPLTPETRMLINARALARMKPTAILVNTARGGLVDDAALLDALASGRIAGAGLDVFQSESDPSCMSVTRALIALPNVIATPHSGASTREGLVRTNRIAAQCVVAVLEGRAPPSDCVIADGRHRAEPTPEQLKTPTHV
ncbi:phosphoglycerate dehydrogenase [Variovorax beijingensis]|uniref:Hydroxyacid dehydrogenase n=1 Tax=Variovorax beijingensis TaxID=2496117 RepID=A0ABY0A2Z3_9BURK|nr:phosphoglycerate dehydrogenase [Variovorax beijingensis]RSZ32832.1 hydroxyacid dehydrogenase [Variovorax beijingensis]